MINKIFNKIFKGRSDYFSLTLIAIVFFAFLIRIININYNSVFLDEGIYILLGKQFLAGEIGEVADSISWVGGFPFFYPFLSSLFFSVGGIIGARLFTVILGVVSVALIYFFSRDLHLFREEKANKVTGLVAAGFLATSTIPVAFSRLAIYDTLSFTIFLISLVIFQRAFMNSNEKLYLASALFMFLSFLAKYITVIFLPLFIALTLYLFITSDTKARRKVVKIIKSFWYPLFFLNLLYFGLNAKSLFEFFLFQTLDTSPISAVIDNFWNYSSIYFFLAFGGIVFIIRRRRTFVTILLVLSFLPLIYYLAIRNSVSVHQHVTLSLIFILPLTSAFFASIIQRNKYIGVISVFAVVILSTFHSLEQVREFDAAWPDTYEAIEVLSKKVGKEDRIFAEADSVIILALDDKLPPESITGPFYFEYREDEGFEAYKRAISDRHFDFIELEGSIFTKEQINQFENSMGVNYSLIYYNGEIKIYELL